MNDDLDLPYRPFKKKKQRRVRCIGVIIAIIAAFLIGFLIGYFAFKSKSKDHTDNGRKRDKKADFQKRQEDMMKHHKVFQGTVSEDKLRSTLR